jgi:LAO/AO transport system kinase
MSKLAEEILNKNVKSAAKLIRKVEDEDPDVYDDLSILYPHTGGAYILGITGLPGSGKSTIINSLIKHYRNIGKSVGVLAVDPSSPVSSGSILGDRIRMLEHSVDKEVFIKSLATRGWYGGLSKTTSRIINILDAMGKDVIILETVGVGQTEVSIMNFAQTTVLVLVPEMGDYIQTIKAGILEIGDIFVINKIDKREPAELLQNIEALIHQEKTGPDDWKKSVILSSAVSSEGFEELLGVIDSHKKYFLENKKAYYLKNRVDNELKDEIYGYFLDTVIKKLDDDENFIKTIEDIISKKTDPYISSKKIIKDLEIR